MPKFIMTQAERERRRAARRSAQVKAMFPAEPPKDVDKVRTILARKIAMSVGDQHKSWRGCPERMCRRQRACMAPRIECSNAPLVPPSTSEHQASSLAMLKRMLREKLAAHEAAGEM
jgi:hypothetical protein